MVPCPGNNRTFTASIWQPSAYDHHRIHDLKRLVANLALLKRRFQAAEQTRLCRNPVISAISGLHSPVSIKTADSSARQYLDQACYPAGYGAAMDSSFTLRACTCGSVEHSRFIGAQQRFQRPMNNSPEASAGNRRILPMSAFSNVPYRKPPGGGAMRSFG